MTKLKTPLLGLAARGTIGNAITFQKRGQTTFAREKPIPSYRRTLLQQYQRWLYEDYAYLWTQQTGNTKRQYAAAGSRFHLTGFQYWMKYNLTHLPDIAAWFKADINTGGILYDASKVTNNGTIYGASPSGGYIGPALIYDGINDYCLIPHHAKYNINQKLTIEAIVRCTDITKYRQIIVKNDTPSGYNDPFMMCIDITTGRLRARIGNGTTDRAITGSTNLLNKTAHVLFKYDLTYLYLFVDGISDATPITKVITPLFNTTNIRIGIWANFWFKGIIDNLIIYTRDLDSTEIKRHSLRRYPSQ